MSEQYPDLYVNTDETIDDSTCLMVAGIDKTNDKQERCIHESKLSSLQQRIDELEKCIAQQDKNFIASQETAQILSDRIAKMVEVANDSLNKDCRSFTFYEALNEIITIGEGK